MVAIFQATDLGPVLVNLEPVTAVSKITYFYKSHIAQAHTRSNSLLLKVAKQINDQEFISVTGVYPRQPLSLLEEANFHNKENGTTFVMSDGTRVPPLSYETYQAVKQSLPSNQQAVLDEKLFWLLQRNPALPLIANGLQKGHYQKFIQGEQFNTDAYYKEVFFRQLFTVAKQADVELKILRPLVEIHLVTLDASYFEGLENEPEGVVKSFYQNEIDLTNKQYLLRSLIQSPLESIVRFLAVQYVEDVKADYTLTADTSTTITQGRLPLPTPTAAEDTPGAHAIAIAHLNQAEINLFPLDVGQAAMRYRNQFQINYELEQELINHVNQLTQDHAAEILKAIEGFTQNRFWRQIGITRNLGLKSVHQLDTSRMLGIYATRHEGLTPKLRAYQSYRKAVKDLTYLYRNNPLQFDDEERLQLFLSDQILNRHLWQILEKRLPKLRPELTQIQQTRSRLESAYQKAAGLEADFFKQLQIHDLDISTEAFVLLSVAMARRFTDLAEAELNPENPQDPNYLTFVQGMIPFQRDMPDMNVQWGDGREVKRYGLENYLVPDLMALHSRDAPMLRAIAHLYRKMEQAGDLEPWDFETLVKLISTACNLSVGKNPATLPAEQAVLLPLVVKYQSELKQITGADGMVGTSILHGLGAQDFRIASWPEGRQPNPAHNFEDIKATLAEMGPKLTDVKSTELTDILTRGSSELSLSLKLVLQHEPKFIAREDGRLDLTLKFKRGGLWRFCIWDVCRVKLEGINYHFQTVFSPIYMSSIVLPKNANQQDAAALNQVIADSHAIYGGYTPAQLELPDSLRFVY
ncbi:MAG: hypothetical protein F6K42_01510 [Leptolyngbya sp. SIO1D8]|nr:hypothetical protein [Leptolyngbya sp. SIO1D8]